MESPALISVIIPTRNRLAFLRTAVASVAGQSFRDWELIVVDDCSQDGTWDWLQTLVDPRIHPIRMEQRGWQSAARNAGLRVAGGEFVLFLDHDDFLLPGALALLLKSLKQHDAAIAAVGARVNVQEGVQEGGQRRVAHPRHAGLRDPWLDVMFGWVPQCGQVLLRRTAAVKAGAWRDAFIPAEDHDFWVRLSPLGPIVLVPQIVLGYRIHPGQTLKVFEAAGAARSTRILALRRSSLAGLSQEDRVRGERTVQAWRHMWIATRAFRRGRYGVAFLHWWRSVRKAPWLLQSPISRREITSLGSRFLAAVVLGTPGIAVLRRFKRILRSALPYSLPRRSSSQEGWEIERPGAP